MACPEAVPGVKDSKGLAFPSRKGGHRVDIRKAIDAASKKAGIAMHITPHMLRHAFCTLLLAKTGNLRLVQRGAGHKKIETTLKNACRA